MKPAHSAQIPISPVKTKVHLAPTLMICLMHKMASNVDVIDEFDRLKRIKGSFDNEKLKLGNFISVMMLRAISEGLLILLGDGKGVW